MQRVAPDLKTEGKKKSEKKKVTVYQFILEPS